MRYGRPPRELAGQVEERILDAAGHVFLEHGFQGASVDEIAEVASAGKPTIYARFPEQAGVVHRRRRAARAPKHESRRFFLRWRINRGAARRACRRYSDALLTPETIGLIRVAVAEARRFPDLATSVSCMGRERPTEAVARVFGGLAGVRRHRSFAGLRAGKAHGDSAPVSRPGGIADAGESAVRRGSGRAAGRDRAARGPVGRLLSRRLRLTCAGAE